MTKNYLEVLSRFALFRDKEAEPGQSSESGGVSVAMDAGSGIKSKLSASHDGDSVSGSELPTAIYAFAREASGKLSQEMAKPDFLAFVLAYFFGECSSVLAGTTAYRHSISPCQELEPPSFTAVQKRGANIFTERLSGNYIESFSLELGEGWVSLSADVTGTGHRQTNYMHEMVTAPANANSITLSENAVEGDTEAERMANVYRVRAKDAGSEVWRLLSISSVSADTPVVISFAEPLGTSSDNVDFHVDYIPEEPAWCSLPGFIDESPLKLTDARLMVDAHYDGSSLQGGEELAVSLESFSISGKNNLEIKRFPGDSGPAACGLRGKREITISLTESLRSSVRQYQADNPDTEQLSVAFLLQGAEIDEGEGYRFGAEIIFPKVGIMEAPIETQAGRLAQAGDLVVMDDGAYGGVLINCFNRQSGYL
ncbi:MAG: hypothetical protein R6V10_02255 [bacterium]